MPTALEAALSLPLSRDTHRHSRFKRPGTEAAGVLSSLPRRFSVFTLKRSIPLFVGQWLALAALATASLAASGQTVPLAQEMHAYAYFSPTGLTASQPGVAASHEVRVEGADSLRLQLADVKLPKGAQLVITS